MHAQLLFQATEHVRYPEDPAARQGPHSAPDDLYNQLVSLGILRR